MFSEGKKTLKELTLDLPTAHVIKHMSELAHASHKAEEVERMIKENEWKINHDNEVITYFSINIRIYDIVC